MWCKITYLWGYISTYEYILKCPIRQAYHLSLSTYAASILNPFTAVLLSHVANLGEWENESTAY